MNCPLVGRSATLGLTVVVPLLSLARTVAAAEWQSLQMSAAEQSRWMFIGGPWSQDGDVLVPNPNPEQHHRDENLAFHTAAAYGDFEAEFEFRIDSIISGTGFVFRARDANHYYMVQFPTTGQQYRAEHFWAAVCRVGDSGLVEVLHMQLVPGVPSEVNLWHKARVVVEGESIRVWVDGRPLAEVRDGTYREPGLVGLESYGGIASGPRSVFRNVRVRGEAGDPPACTEQYVQNWFRVTLDERFGGEQNPNSIARAPNGELLMMIDTGSHLVLIRSRDNARTWSEMEEVSAHGQWTDDNMPPLLFASRKGELSMFKQSYAKPQFVVTRATSADDGHTWSEFREVHRFTIEPVQNQAWMYGGPIELQDGTVVWSGVMRSPESKGNIGGTYYENIRMPGAMNFVIRSSDGGETWSAPVDVNGPNPSPGAWQYAKDHHPSEGSIGQCADGTLICFVRSIVSPWVWESRSPDGGQTWTPQARGPFGMWASSHIVRTQSGALLIAGRHPGLAVQLSRDSGMTWRCFQIDTVFWANGILAEVEPDVVLYVAKAKNNDPKIRAYLMRVTADALVPVRP